MPRPPAFADEFQFVLPEGFPSASGGLGSAGLEQRIEAYHIIDSLEPDTPRFRIGDLDERIMKLKTLPVSLGSRDCASFSAMVGVDAIRQLPVHAGELEIYSQDRIQAFKRSETHRIGLSKGSSRRNERLLAWKIQTELLDLKGVSVKMTSRYPKLRLDLSGLVTRAR